MLILNMTSNYVCWPFYSEMINKYLGVVNQHMTPFFNVAERRLKRRDNIVMKKKTYNQTLSSEQKNNIAEFEKKKISAAFYDHLTLGLRTVVKLGAAV